MQNSTRKIGIMGGTFDPIHYGHLLIAEFARTKFFLERVMFIPAKEPPHKPGQKVAPAEDRHKMVSLAIESNPHFAVSRIELDRTGPSYSVDTLKVLNQQYGAANELYFIIGADAILEVMTWKNVQEVMKLCRFLAATRPGYSLNKLSEQINMLPIKYRSRIQIFEIPFIDISSTDIRSFIKNKYPIKYLVPEDVEKYIKDKSLYL